MIKIGDFSTIAHVTVKTLHHYGDMGLLKPSHVDRFTGYRYYTLDQLGHLNRILALKDLGFTLEQVAQLLNEDLSLEGMRGMLRMKQMELARNLAEEQSRLDRVEQRLLQLEEEGCPPVSEVAIKEVQHQTAISARVVAANHEAISPTRNSLQQILSKHLERAHLKPSTPWFGLVDSSPYAENNLEVELAIGVHFRKGQRSDDWGNTPIRLVDLPESRRMASIIQENGNPSPSGIYAQFYGWMQSNGYKVAGPFREIYLPGSGGKTHHPANLDNGFTELQCPIQQATIPISVQTPNNRKEKMMKPKIITKPAFKAIGMSYIGKNEAGEIPQMWGEYNSRFNEIEAVNEICFGLCFSNPEGAAEGEFEYVAATEVKSGSNIPDGMVYREVPEYRYAVFTHYGKLDNLGETYEYIYNTWLPQSGFKIHRSKFDMEVYDHRFIPDSDESALDIYVALK